MDYLKVNHLDIF